MLQNADASIEDIIFIKKYKLLRIILVNKTEGNQNLYNNLGVKITK